MAPKLSDRSNHSSSIVSPVKRENLQDLILDRLRDFVVSEDLQPGDKLPPERELALHLKVSRPSLRLALNWLSARGALRRVQGGGTFMQENFLSVLTQSQVAAAPNRHKKKEIIEAQEVLEPMLVQLAVEHGKPEEINALYEEVCRAEELVHDSKAWCQHDLQFHARVAQIAGNAILADAHKPIYSYLLDCWTSHSESFDRGTCFQGHKNVVEAMREGDSQKAAEKMREHIRQFQQAIPVQANSSPA